MPRIKTYPTPEQQKAADRKAADGLLAALARDDEAAQRIGTDIARMLELSSSKKAAYGDRDLCHTVCGLRTAAGLARMFAEYIRAGI